MATEIVANYLHPPALIALSFQNGMGYRYLNERINSVNDASVLCENFVKFGLAVFELIMLRLGQYFAIFVHLAYWRLETDWNVTILISAV